MKFIYLAAGKNNFHLDSKEDAPKCLTIYNNNETIFDKILSNLDKVGVDKIFVVGGYKILSIIEMYPLLKYFYNNNWKNTKSLATLYGCKSEFNDDLIISYSDVVYQYQLLNDLIVSKYDITIGYDSKWKNRYSGRGLDFLSEAEKIIKKENGDIRIDKRVSENENVIGEFMGVFQIKRSVANLLEKEINSVINVKNNNASVCDLINHLQKDYSIGFVDVEGDWAELDSPEDLVNFKFGTKADTLKRLESKLELSHVLGQYKFTVEDFEQNFAAVVTEMQQSISSPKLVVRSSALNEDTFNSSMAGNYESILNVDRNNKDSIFEACKLVINSYLKGGQERVGENQILVQPQLENVQLSGVVFTKDLETSAPYYIINYDVSDKTDSITSGIGAGQYYTYIYYKFSKNLPKDKNLRAIINAVKEVEVFTQQNSLDIEFAIAMDKVYVLQVRPIAAHKDEIKVFEQDIQRELEGIKHFLAVNKNAPPKIVGDQNVYGVMPDWNPAEIIGIKPNPLSFDLYKYIITDHVWSKTRAEVGYRDIGYHPGIYSFSGQPYVDVRMSFNTFTPKKINDQLAQKLINYYLEKLKKYPENHDKVEFEIAITSYDFDFDAKMDELDAEGFTKIEQIEITEAFKELTKNVLLEKEIKIDDELDKTRSLTNRRNEIIASSLDLPSKIIKLLEDCKKYGTEPFSILARYGFFGSILMKSLVKKKLISDNEYHKFFNSVQTVATDFVLDLNKISETNFTRKEFIQKYGHLRPGTYDINSKTYAENFDNYIDINRISSSEDDKSISNYDLTIETKNKIQIEIDKNGLDINVDTLLLFVKKATEARELAKFEFTKNLSLAIDYIVDFGKELGVTRSDMAFCNLNSILRLSDGSISSNIINEICNQIEYNKKKHIITSAIKLPELIFSSNDVNGFYYENSKPNFITQMCIEGQLVVLSSEKVDITDKIVVIENADPGFDWIFSHKIKGLVTKYGGAASHMAIRCSEFGLPAAIGCGTKIFESLENYDIIQLDCLNQKINKF
ncbi:PEP/pyruvate-binding domain-containing protein [Xanthomarina gelatinilytica]|uniref:PEP/pyruvate-binding domain-containing protein n=1 Tax=Xanthomarina gelatinilytica TaxID=1137281 RepID=UPI003AA802FC